MGHLTHGSGAEEVKSIFRGRLGINGFCREGDEVVVEHDTGVVTVEQLMDVFRGLPSFYDNHFVPSMMENPGRSD